MADRCYYCQARHARIAELEEQLAALDWREKRANAHIRELEEQLAALDWREITEKDLPKVGVPVLVVWNGCVQKIAYVRTEIGFARTEGYVWETAYDIGYDPIPDGEVTHYAPLLDPPSAPARKEHGNG